MASPPPSAFARVERLSTLAAVLLAVAFAPAGEALEQADDGSTPPVPASAEQWDTTLTYGARLSTPQIASVSIGTVMGPTRCGDVMCVAHGLLLQLEPGVGGGKASVGYGFLGGAEERILGAVPFGVAVKASLLQSWGSRDVLPPGQTYLGGELDVSAYAVKLSFGVFAHARGEEGEDRVVVSWGIGFGF